MNRTCDMDNPLVRDGVSQIQRPLPALDSDDPRFFKIDDRSASDLLWFAYRYAKYLQYYDADNKPAGDWQAFLENDVATIIAMMSTKDVSMFKNCFDVLVPVFKSEIAFDQRLKRAIEIIFDIVLTIAYTINEWYEKLAEGLSAKAVLHRIITANLSDLLHKAISYYNFAKKEDWFTEEGAASVPNECKEGLLKAGDVLTRSFNCIWISKSETGGSNESLQWDQYRDGIEVDVSFASNKETARSRLTFIFEGFYNALRQINQQAPDFFQEVLDRWPSHEPHMALFLTFLRLFETEQKHLNSITRRHLDFYYKKVLQFVEEPQKPDEVHVIFELAKQASPHLLKAGTLLKAGKDNEGNDVFYKLNRDITVNKAAVSELKTVFIDRRDNYGHHVYASPYANSQDGQGKAFDTDEPRWRTFGESPQIEKYGSITQEDIKSKFGEVGFAITSPILLLKEGDRTVMVTFKGSDASSEQKTLQNFDTCSSFSACFSGEKGWIEVPQNAITPSKDPFAIKITLSSAFPPIVACEPKALGRDYGTNFPVLKITLNQPQVNPSCGYEKLKDLELTEIDLSVEVKGIKNLIIQNDFGVLDASKPFQPFGPTPVVGSSLYVGSNEVFRKNVDSITLDIKWLDVPSDVVDRLYKANVYVLEGSAWGDKRAEFLLFKSNNTSEPTGTNIGGLKIKRAPLLDAIEVYDNTIQQGFLKFELASPPESAFGHADFARIYAKKVIELSKLTKEEFKDLPAPVLPEPPYTPVIKSITLDYFSEVTIFPNQPADVAERLDKYYHLYPFGYREANADAETHIHVLPQFESVSDGATVENEGELYIGLSGLEPRQNLSVLFHVAEGSADPELPEQEIDWSYLSRNRWLAFAPNEIVADSTNGLLSSGVITFDVPEAADNNNTLLPKGMHWLRASVTENSRAVCDLIDVRSQAARASFVDDRKNASDFLAHSLPKGSISKLQVKQAAIKTISQPYASFGGRVRETKNQFYARVSERLRHKARGVTIWDYERLVLERFPRIYKVKCINHSTYNFKTAELEITRSEFAPGFVTVIVIPDLNNKNAVNKLEPRASLGVLEEIRSYLSKKIPPFAARNLRVINPLYEPVQVEFHVKLKDGCDWGYYETTLNKDIMQFLSPWAFEGGKDIIFGGKLHKSVILNFVEERNYVDYVIDFKMHHTAGGLTRSNINEAVPGTARSILVSHSLHKIKPAE